MSVKLFQSGQHSLESPNVEKVNDNCWISWINKETMASVEDHVSTNVFAIEKGNPVAGNYLGPAAFIMLEGEMEIKDRRNPGEPIMLTRKGDVVILEKGALVDYSTPSRGSGFEVLFVPGSTNAKDYFQG